MNEESDNPENFDWSLGVHRPSTASVAYYSVELIVYEDQPRKTWKAQFITTEKNRDEEVFKTEPCSCRSKGAAVNFAVSRFLNAIDDGQIPFNFYEADST